MTREEIENLVFRLLDAPSRFAAETSDHAALRRRKTEHDASAALRALMARAEAAEEREEATRAANVDAKLNWDMLRVDYDAACARAEAAEARVKELEQQKRQIGAERVKLFDELTAAEAEVRKLREALTEARPFVAHFKGGWSTHTHGQISVEELLSTINAALSPAPDSEPPAATKWQPIETAPENKRVLLCDATDGEIRVGMARWGWTRGNVNNWSEDGNATHWMPLPAAPAPAREGETT